MFWRRSKGERQEPQMSWKRRLVLLAVSLVLSLSLYVMVRSGGVGAVMSYAAGGDPVSVSMSGDLVIFKTEERRFEVFEPTPDGWTHHEIIVDAVHYRRQPAEIVGVSAVGEGCFLLDSGLIHCRNLTLLLHDVRSLRFVGCGRDGL